MVYPAQGAAVTKSKDDSWTLNLNGLGRNFAIAPDMFDSCIIDPDSLCPFGFVVNVWVQFGLSLKQYFAIEKSKTTFEQILFYTGSSDLNHGLETSFSITPSNQKPTTFDYQIKINYKLSKFNLITKRYKINVDDISKLNSLNCIVIQFSDKKEFSLNWLDFQVEELNDLVNVRSDRPNSISSSYSMQRLDEYGIKTPLPLTSNSIALFGDPEQNSFFKIKHFEIKNFVDEDTVGLIEHSFRSQVPNIVYQLSAGNELLNRRINKNFDAYTSMSAPQLVDTRYGKSMLFSKTDQALVIKRNATSNESCFDDFGLCKNGYTFKMWLCFTNYNLIKLQQQQLSLNKETDNLLFNQKVNKEFTQQIIILSKKDMQIVYDVDKSLFRFHVRNKNTVYKSEISFNLKLYMWYIITISWEQQDGLRLYINNKLLDHNQGEVVYNLTDPTQTNMIDFTLGRANNDHQAKPTNNYYEFIVHKIVQYDARKYPDEIIAKNTAFQGEFLEYIKENFDWLNFFFLKEKRLKKASISVNWIWYVISGSFLLTITIVLSVFGLFMKRRSQNGFWSRENELNKKSDSKGLRCFSIFNNENTNEFLDTNTSRYSLELKQCQAKEEKYINPLSIEDYLSNSLYGTINRLITKQQVIESLSASSQSATVSTNNLSHNTDGTLRNSTSSYIIANGDEEIINEIHF